MKPQELTTKIEQHMKEIQKLANRLTEQDKNASFVGIFGYIPDKENEPNKLTQTGLLVGKATRIAQSIANLINDHPDLSEALAESATPKKGGKYDR